MHYVFAECTYRLLCAAASAKVAAANVGRERAQIERVITQVCSGLFYLTENGTDAKPSAEGKLVCTMPRCEGGKAHEVGLKRKTFSLVSSE